MDPFFEETVVFEANTEGYPVYRIPSLIKPPNGDLLAFAEGRFGGDHNNVDLVMKRSTDNGQTWSNLQVIWGDQFTDGTTIGNPTPVVDELTGTIWLPVIQDQFEVLLFSSADNGNTWSGPVNISDQVKNPDFPFGPAPANDKQERIIWTGPGIGIQIQSGPNAGRLVIPAHFQPFDEPPVEDEDFGKVYRNQMWVFYSDDNGQTWNFPDSSVLGNESQVVELSNNNLLLNGRNQAATDPTLVPPPVPPFFRLNATSSDGGDNFTDSVPAPPLIDPVVQASIFRYSFDGNGDDNIILFSNPVSSPDADPPFRSRNNLTVRLSNDDGQTWPIDRLINPEFSAYSSLARQANDNIGLLYEGLSPDANPGRQPRGNITFANFNLEWLAEESTNPPTANDDSFDNIPENSLSNVLDVLVNDDDPDGDPLAIIAVGNISNNGTVIINETNDGLLYSPASGFTGTETFTYTLSDDTDRTDEALVTVVVNDMNQAPIATNDLFDNIERDSTNNLLDVLANDSDPDDDPLTIVDVGNPSNGGTLDINSNGDGLIYAPASAFVGEETFTYIVSDGRGANIQADVTVSVVGDPSLFSTDWDTLSGWNTSGAESATDIVIDPPSMLRLFDNADTTTKVFRSDVDIPNTYALEFTAQVEQFTASNKVSLGAKIRDGDFRLMFQRRSDGFYVIDDSNTWVQLRPTSEFTEAADYRIEVNNGVGSLFARVSGNDLFTFAGDWNLQTRQQPDLIEHWVRGLPSDPAEARIDSTRILELDPLGDFNNPPVANNDLFDTIQQNSADNVLNVLNNDNDPDGDLLTLLSVEQPNNGEVFINSTQDGLIYKPAAGFVGEETFNYTIVDHRGGADRAEATVTVSEDSSIFSTNWEDLEGWNTSGTESETDIVITQTGELRLFDNADTTTKVFRSDIDIPNTYALEFTAQVDQYTTDDKVSLGAKIQDGNHRLMFQRRSDGFYVIDDSNTWVQLRPTSEFTESADYRIEVNNGVGSLFARVSDNDLFSFAGDWNLQPFQRPDLVEHWVRGIIENPAEAKVDSTRILELDPLGDFNNPPVANNDLFDTIQQNSADNVLNVLNNDNDPDGDLLTLLSVEQPNNGEVFINSTQDSLIYKPAAGFVGEETFNYTVIDSRNVADQAEVTVTVSEDSSIFSTNWEDLEGWNASGAESETDIAITETGELRLFDNADTTTKVFRSDVDIPDAYSIEFKAQVDQYTTDDKVSLGVKVQDGDFRLMLQRKSDGFYVIDDTNTWTRLTNISGEFEPEFTEPKEYKIDVDNGKGILFSRASGFDSYVVEGEWDLQPFERSDLVEHWVRGIAGSPAEARFDMTRILDPTGVMMQGQTSDIISSSTSVEIAQGF